jgi:hypothetical protein
MVHGPWSIKRSMDHIPDASDSVEIPDHTNSTFNHNISTTFATCRPASTAEDALVWSALPPCLLLLNCNVQY